MAEKNLRYGYCVQKIIDATTIVVACINGKEERSVVATSTAKQDRMNEEYSPSSVRATQTRIKVGSFGPSTSNEAIKESGSTRWEM
jgi:hypothetical protein